MSPNRCRTRRVMSAMLLGLWAASCIAGDQGVVFRAAPASAPVFGEPVAVLEPADGQFTYSSDGHAVHHGPRFAIGAAPRTDLVVFSAEEQTSLEELRQKLIASAAASSPAQSMARPSARATPRLVAHHASRLTACATDKLDPAMTAMAWPEVVRDERKVCVPKLEYADQGDWRDHMWCFDKGDGNVR